MRARDIGGMLLLSFLVVIPVRAQDQGLDPLLFGQREETAASSDVQANAAQLYRLPFGFHLRSLAQHPWGLRVTFPVSLSSVRIEGTSNLGYFARKFGIAAIIPGLEVEIPVGSHVLVRPFGEAGIGKSNESSTEVLYGAGVRVRTSSALKGLQLTYGGAAAGRKRPALVGGYDRYGSFEAGVDAQVPLGFSVGTKAARGGIYVIGRAFDGLQLQREGQPPVDLHGQVEAGASFSTTPVLRVWKIPLPWLAAGYQFGHTVSGVRIYMTFPF